MATLSAPRPLSRDTQKKTDDPTAGIQDTCGLANVSGLINVAGDLCCPLACGQCGGAGCGVAATLEEVSRCTNDASRILEAARLSRRRTVEKEHTSKSVLCFRPSCLSARHVCDTQRRRRHPPLFPPTIGNLRLPPGPYPVPHPPLLGPKCLTTAARRRSLWRASVRVVRQAPRLLASSRRVWKRSLVSGFIFCR